MASFDGASREGTVVLAVVLCAATGFGLWRKKTDGALRLSAGETVESEPIEALGQQATGPVGHEVLHVVVPAAQLDTADLAENAAPAGRQPSPEPRADEFAALLAVVGDPGPRATFVQFSSAFCAPCRTARVVLAEAAARIDGVRHVEVDAEAHLALVRQLGISRTPTTLVLDGVGREVGRAVGVPRRTEIDAAVAALNG